MKFITTFLFFIGCSLMLFGQTKKVAITMDDMPFNAFPKTYSVEEVQAATTILLNKITEGQTPVAAFINGKYCLTPSETALRINVLKQWLNHPLITVGNHTLNHLNHSNEDLATFKSDVLKNDYLIKSLTIDKSVEYFRFPYNALGKDSVSQKERADFLKAENYISSPFTLESVDYMYNALYVDALQKGKKKKAASIGQAYVDFTIEVFEHYEAVCLELYERPINHIFLCHSNPLHVEYYDVLIERIKALGYEFVTIEEAMKDEVYQTTNYYHKKWGVSWIYRWMPDSKKRMEYMRKGIEPDKKLYKAYQKLMEKK